MPVEKSPFDVLSDFRVSRDHLVEEHHLSPVWTPREEAFEDFLERATEIHRQEHEGAAVMALPMHTHRPNFVGNGCPVCDGWGWVVGHGVKRPMRLPCPECAGLDITPASADDERRDTATG